MITLMLVVGGLKKHNQSYNAIYNMKPGNTVKYRNNQMKRVGTILEAKGKKWFRVVWSDGIICDEHVNDLRIVI